MLDLSIKRPIVEGVFLIVPFTLKFGLETDN